MSELFIGLCSYLALQSNADKACRTASGQAYNQSILRPYFDEEQKRAESWGLGLYTSLPYNKPLGAVALIGYESYKKDFKIYLTNSINLEYSNFNAYTCNLKWEF
jgi:hypothetical protein